MSFKKGDKVRFLPGPRSSAEVTATVPGETRGFLVTKDSAGRERKVRPGACKAA